MAGWSVSGAGVAGNTRMLVDLTDLDFRDGFVIQGGVAGGNEVLSVSGAGDVNGDGIDDVIVGATGVVDRVGRPGESYVIDGSSNLASFYFYGSALNDTLRGDTEDNLIDGGAGADLMIGDAGSDRFIVDDLEDQVFESRNWAGTDTVFSSVDFSLGRQHIEDLQLTGEAVTGIGNGLMNTLTGNDQDNTLDGGRNADTMIGEDGDDTYFVQDFGDVVIEESGEGENDLIKSWVSFELGDNLENLHLLSRNNINGTGNDRHNTLIGNMGDNVLDGGGKRDILKGQGGADTFVFSDVVSHAQADQIIDFTSGEDKIALDLGLGAAGTLSADAFLLANGNNDSADRALYGSEDRVIYDATSGKLWVDTDGSGDEATRLVATLLNHAELSADDFILL
ncbi:MAG: calcium-binding protein [Sulfitobacter sp.]